MKLRTGRTPLVLRVFRAAQISLGVVLVLSCGDARKPFTPPQVTPPDNGGPASSRVFAVNEVTARLQNDGSAAQSFDGMFWFRGGPLVYDLGLWIGARVEGEVRVSATSYFAPDFTPLPLGPADSLAQVYLLVEGDGPGEADYDAWPISAGAPADALGLPRRVGEATAWTAFSDQDPERHLAFRTAPLGAEVRQTVWGYGSPDSVLFLRYQVLNASQQIWSDVFLGLWCDADLGSAGNDLVGCDRGRSLGFTYTSPAEPESLWGALQPAFGIRLLDTPEGTGFYAFPQIIKAGTEPRDATDAYNFLRGLDRDGNPFVDPTNGRETRYAADGDPVTGQGWIETRAMDRRMLLVTGPYTVPPGRNLNLTIALICARDPDPLSAITRLREAADGVASSPSLWDLFADE